MYASESVNSSSVLGETQVLFGGAAWLGWLNRINGEHFTWWHVWFENHSVLYGLCYVIYWHFVAAKYSFCIWYVNIYWFCVEIIIICSQFIRKWMHSVRFHSIRNEHFAAQILPPLLIFHRNEMQGDSSIDIVNRNQFSHVGKFIQHINIFGFSLKLSSLA